MNATRARLRPVASGWIGHAHPDVPALGPFPAILARTMASSRHERGVRPVVYGNEANWHDLNEHDQSYFQLAHSRAVGVNETDAEHESAAGIEWTVEREWRHIGDLDLRELPRESGLVFVRNYAAAKRVSTVSPWPVTLWPDPWVEVIGN